MFVPIGVPRHNNGGTYISLGMPLTKLSLKQVRSGPFMYLMLSTASRELAPSAHNRKAVPARQQGVILLPIARTVVSLGIHARVQEYIPSHGGSRCPQRPGTLVSGDAEIQCNIQSPTHNTSPTSTVFLESPAGQQPCFPTKVFVVGSPVGNSTKYGKRDTRTCMNPEDGAG